MDFVKVEIGIGIRKPSLPIAASTITKSDFTTIAKSTIAYSTGSFTIEIGSNFESVVGLYSCVKNEGWVKVSNVRYCKRK